MEFGFQEAGSLVCVQEKLKQLQADVDCILKACYGECQGKDDGPCGRGKPDCEALHVRLTLCCCCLTDSLYTALDF